MLGYLIGGCNNFPIMKINDLIKALKEQEKEHGNIELSIEIMPSEKQLPKEGTSNYYHMFGPWYLCGETEDGDSHSTFELHKDEHGDWLSMTFTGKIDGEFSQLSHADLRHEAKLDRKMG